MAIDSKRMDVLSTEIDGNTQRVGIFWKATHNVMSSSSKDSD